MSSSSNASKHQGKPPRARWMLHLQAVMWRFLMGIGMFLHKFASPRPAKPNFTHQIPATISGKPGWILLHFYVPKDYETQKRLGRYKARQDFEIVDGADEEEGGMPGRTRNGRMSATFSAVGETIRRRSTTVRRWGGYPVVVNFHGGGFTLGTATDDARWCGTVVDECDAVVVSVDYRKAPEMPFPTAVEDGVDAVIWIHEHADEFGIDREKIAISGFSSGGNMAITVPLRLYDEQAGFPRDDESRPSSRQKAERALQGAATEVDTPSSSKTRVGAQGYNDNNVEMLRPEDPSPSLPGRTSNPSTSQPNATQIKEASTTVTERKIPNVKIRCIIPWYPSLDYTRTREERRATCVRKDQELPSLFTDLFDESYLHPPATISLDSPYLSPGVAPTELLKNALPDEIVMHTCEYDMLLDEGQAFRERLESPPLNKKVTYVMVEGVPHGWDKAPNPLKPTPGVREHYLRACREMRRVFGPTPGIKEHPTAQGPSAAPRGSVQVVN